MAQQQGAVEADMVSQSDFMKAIGILRSDKLRGFKIDIETDSTIPADKEAEQGKAVEFLGAVGQYLTAVMPAVQGGIVPVKVAREGLLFGVRRFKVGSEFEEVIEELGAGQDDGQMRQQNQQQGQQIAQLTQQVQELQQQNAQLQADRSVEMQKAQADSQTKQQSATFDAQLKAQDQAHQQRLDNYTAAHKAMLDEHLASVKALVARNSAKAKNGQGARP
jgi:hypothetical protein